MMDAQPTDRKPFTGWHALACFLGFFAVMFAVNGVFLYQAITSFPGEDVPKSYLQGLNYNSQLDTRAVQAKTGWRAEIGIDDQYLVFRLKNELGHPIGGQHVSVTFRRLATTSSDVTLEMTARNVGEYVVPIADLERGQWDAIATAYTPDPEQVHFVAHKTVMIQ